MSLPKYSFAYLALSGLAASAAVLHPQRITTSPAAIQNGAYYDVAGVGKFNTHLSVDFTNVTSLPSSLRADTYEVGGGAMPYSHLFEKHNVVVNKGDSLSLLIPGGQHQNPLSTAQIVTAYDDILYGSVRTVAKASAVPGSCHGFFFYLNDNQETDIEILTSDTSVVHFTDQSVKVGGQSTTTTANSPTTITSAYHEYRLDWVPGKTMYYIDGVLKKTITTNVPSKAGSWLWNNWSSGGDGWTKGPPNKTSDLRIRSIEAYFNRTSVATQQAKKSHT